MAYLNSIYILVPAEKYIHILKECLGKKKYHLIFCFAESSVLNFVVIHLNVTVCDLSQKVKNVHSHSEKIISPAPVPTDSKWNRDSGESGNAPFAFSSPYLEWQSWTHTLFQPWALMLCLCEYSHRGCSFHKNFRWSIFCLASANKVGPSPSLQDHKRTVPAVWPPVSSQLPGWTGCFSY